MQAGPRGRNLRTDGNRSDGSAAVDQKVAVVRQFALFANASYSDCASIVSGARERHYSRRETLFVEGEPTGQIWLLVSGCAKVTQFSQNGGGVILRLNGPGDLIGVFGASSEGRHQTTARALKASTTLAWDTSVFEAMSEQFPMLRRNLAHILGQRLREMEERFREISTERVASRLSSQLVRLHGQIGHPEMDGVEVGLSQHELAQLTGTTLFTVSRQLSQWEQRGILKTRREAVVICDLPALVEFSANG